MQAAQVLRLVNLSYTEHFAGERLRRRLSTRRN